MTTNCVNCLSPTECDGIDCLGNIEPVSNQPLIYRLRKRAEIRRQIPDRTSVAENKPDRIADLLDEAANEIERLKKTIATEREKSMKNLMKIIGGTL